MDGPGIAGIFQDFLKILHIWPLILEVRNCALPPKACGYLAEPQTAGRGFPGPARDTDPRLTAFVCL